jgi:hypothetical protein
VAGGGNRCPHRRGYVSATIRYGTGGISMDPIEFFVGWHRSSGNCLRAVSRNTQETSLTVKISSTEARDFFSGSLKEVPPIQPRNKRSLPRLV